MMLVGGMTLSQNLVDLGKQLLEACKNGNTEEVKSLMQSGAPFSTDWLGASPLHFAAQNGHSETIEVLLRAGVSRDTRTKVDRTPLHVAAQEGHLDIVNLLVMHGADIDAKDLLRMTPLHWAVERGYSDIVEALLMNGADADCENKFDKTAVDIAYDTGHTDLVPLLQRYTNSSSPRTKCETKSCTPSNSKTRPIVLPNKSNRTAKIIKTQQPAGTVKHVIVNKADSLTFQNLTKLFSGTNNSSNSNGKNADADAVKWLETQVMSEGDSLVDSVLDSGKSLNLTEAGKLTLNWVKNQNTSSSVSSLPKKIITVNNNNSGKPIILVSSAGPGHQLESHKVTAIAGNSSRKLVQHLTPQQQRSIKITKPVTIAMIPNNVTFARTSNINNQSLRQKQTIVNEKQSIDLEEDEEDETDGDEAESLRKQLEHERRQFKLQMGEKDREIERLKKQVADLSSKTSKK